MDFSIQICDFTLAFVLISEIIGCLESIYRFWLKYPISMIIFSTYFTAIPMSCWHGCGTASEESVQLSWISPPHSTSLLFTINNLFQLLIISLRQKCTKWTNLGTLGNLLNYTPIVSSDFWFLVLFLLVAMIGAQLVWELHLLSATCANNDVKITFFPFGWD